ncbi:MAG TPA: RNA 2',3'-cyclic phosphodiesterase [Gemmatimonadales bacterium]|nr:RNA 2',3'-cyclic phosphodiesterase [Gemmatimonadales bacterium]
MRLFAALPLPAPARAALAALARPLREAGWPVRWVAETQLHLTLKFYGDVAPERLDAVGDVLRAAADGTRPLDLVATALDTLPRGRRARVVIAALDAPPALELLVDRLERGSAALGFPTEGRAFRPHVTLGRVRRDAALPADAARRLAAAAPGEAALAFLVDAAVLFESELGREGPRYTPRVTVPLGERRAA